MSMFDDGHLSEVFTYAANGVTFGVVRLNDGAISKIELR